MTTTNLGEVLRKWRVMRELTIREASKIIGLHYTTYFRLEEGRHPDSETMLKLWNWFVKAKSQQGKARE